MQKFQKITYNGIQKESIVVEFPNMEHIKEFLYERFKNDNDVARYEELKLGNGRESVSLRDVGNKLIVQYKTI